MSKSMADRLAKARDGLKVDGVTINSKEWLAEAGNVALWSDGRITRVHDPRKVLRKGYGCVEGFVMMGAGGYSYDRVEVAEHLSTLFAQDAIDHSKAGDS